MMPALLAADIVVGRYKTHILVALESRVDYYHGYVLPHRRSDRPAKRRIVKRCKDWAEKFGFEFLERIAEGKEKEVSKKKANLKLRAHVAMYLVDRGHGRIPQPLDLSGLDLPAPLNIDFSGISKQDLRKIAKMRGTKK